MASGPAYLPPEVARERVREALDVIDAALARLRECSTDEVGTAFRVEVADRLETQARLNRGLMYRVFGQIAEPPDGPDATGLPSGVKVRDVLRHRLRITAAEVTRRMKVAARICPRRSLSGQTLAAELPVLGAAVDAGALGEDHLREVCKAMDLLPKVVDAAGRARAETILVAHARVEDHQFVTAVGRMLAEELNPEGFFDDTDRQNRRGLVLGPQRPDGMSRLSGDLTPEARAYLEAIAAAVRPGHHLPDSDQTVVDGATDTRTKSQRLHDAFAWGLRTALASGQLGSHRGLPVTVITTTTLAELEQAAAAVADPSLPMPGPARTGGRSTLPMRDLITMAGNGAIHYLVVFDNHSARPLYLGRSHRLATPDQRIVCYARDHGCTHPRCDAPGYHSEVHHAPVDFVDGGPTDADKLFFACGPSHKAATDGTYTTEITDHGRLAWTDGTGPPETNRLHHPKELLADDEHLTDDESS